MATRKTTKKATTTKKTARKPKDGAERVKLFSEEIPVRASVHTINSFSAHADRDELLDWHRRLGTPERTFLVHGEEDTMHRFRAALGERTKVEIPGLGEAFEI